MTGIDSHTALNDSRSYRLSAARDAGALAAAQRLRARCFRAVHAADSPELRDSDSFDDSFEHLLLHNATTGQLIAALRFQVFPTGAQVQSGYCGQYYGLSKLANCAGPVIELGRLCVDPNTHDPGVLRALLSWLARLAQRTQAKMLCGCASFEGTNPAPFSDSFAYLAQTHLAPNEYAPSPIAAHHHALTIGPFDPRRALAQLPPLLRGYLGLGGWVSDHAVVDPDLNTIHVFTAVEVAKIPLARKRSLLGA